MANTLPELVDKLDSFEIIRDQIALLIFENQVAQQGLATAAAKDPDEWKLRVYTERAIPWAQFTNAPGPKATDPPPDTSPVVNVWYETGTFDKSKGDPKARQASSGTFNVDIYGWGIATEQGAGHEPGDLQAALTAQRGLRLCRNFLMSEQNTYLQLQGLVWTRWVQSIREFQVELASDGTHIVIGMRLALAVEFNELSPETVPETLEFVSVDVFRDSDGKLVAEADYDYLAP